MKWAVYWGWDTGRWIEVLHVREGRMGAPHAPRGPGGRGVLPRHPRVLRRVSHRNAKTEDFRRAMEEASGRNLARFFRQWLYRGGIPRVEGGFGTGAPRSLRSSELRPPRRLQPRAGSSAFGFRPRVGVPASFRALRQLDSRATKLAPLRDCGRRRAAGQASPSASGDWRLLRASHHLPPLGRPPRSCSGSFAGLLGVHLDSYMDRFH